MKRMLSYQQYLHEYRYANFFPESEEIEISSDYGKLSYSPKTPKSYIFVQLVFLYY